MSRAGSLAKTAWFTTGCVLLAILVTMAVVSPYLYPSLPVPDRDMFFASPGQLPPFGADDLGRSLLAYALQGASIVIAPAALAGVIVAFFAAVAGLARCAGLTWFDTVLQVFSELMGALPRMVVILVVALAMPREYASLVPIAITWAFLAAPGAMDEAASAAGRLGGARFVEALRAHGFSAARIYLYHITWLNLRAVLIRQGAEVLMQTVFLEIALSYLVQVPPVQADLTHSADVKSWASILYLGFQTVAGGEWFGERSMLHALVLGLALVAGVALMAQSFRMAARQR
jgi:ABC-type dipeptide/oligopeptide/nickel transport system permease subunit